MAQIALGKSPPNYCIDITDSSDAAWVLHQDCVAAPIVGISRLDRFDDVLGALEIKLTEDEMKFLEEPYQP